MHMHVIFWQHICCLKQQPSYMSGLSSCLIPLCRRLTACTRMDPPHGAAMPLHQNPWLRGWPSARGTSQPGSQAWLSLRLCRLPGLDLLLYKVRLNLELESVVRGHRKQESELTGIAPGGTLQPGSRA